MKKENKIIKSNKTDMKRPNRISWNKNIIIEIKNSMDGLTDWTWLRKKKSVKWNTDLNELCIMQYSV